MKDFKYLGSDLIKASRRIKVNLEKAVDNTAEQMKEDARMFAPYQTGKYEESIEVYKKENYKRVIGSNTTCITTGKYPGRKYNLGFLLEHGTEQHAIPGAFYGYAFRPEFGDWEDFHPGFAPMPHYSLSLNRNKKYFKEQISKAIKEV